MMSSFAANIKILGGNLFQNNATEHDKKQDFPYLV